MIAAGALALVAALLLVEVLRLRRRLELVALAEHELRGPLGALALGLEAALGRSTPAPELLPGLELQLQRARMGLADLGAAREGRRATGSPRLVAVEPFVRAVSIGAAPAGPTRRADAPGATIVVSAAREADSQATSAHPAPRGLAAPGAAIRMDPGRLAQALGNVVDNAVEHGGGRVQVRAAAGAHTIRLDVSDRGGGMPARRSSRARRRAGRGRGLMIATQAVEEAGGRLSVRSGAKGSVVSMELPRAEP